jgi:hypothetical protein
MASVYSTASRKLRYHGDGRIVSSVFLTPEGCRELVRVCECHAWRSDPAAAYAFTTVDLEVERAPAVKAWCQRVGLLARVSARVAHAHGGVALTALDDLFVVKYDATSAGGGQQELPRHVDAGDVSFMVALSAVGGDYEGGGTGFDCLGDSGCGHGGADQKAALHLEQVIRDPRARRQASLLLVLPACVFSWPPLLRDYRASWCHSTRRSTTEASRRRAACGTSWWALASRNRVRMHFIDHRYATKWFC